MDPQIVLRRLVEMAGGAAERGYVLALAPAGVDALPAELVTAAGKYAVVQPRSEIALRHILWKANGAPVLALLPEPLARRLPADLVRRSHRRRIHAVEPAEVLSLALGVRVVADDDPAMEALALERVDQIRAMLGQRTLPTVVDRELLDELMLDVVTGGQLRKSTPGSILAAWLREPPTYDPTVAALLKRQLPRVHALVGRVLAWAIRDKKRTEALLVHGVLLALDEPELPPTVWGPLAEAPPAVELTPETFRHVVTTLVKQTLDALGDAATTYLTKAETIGRKSLTAPVLKRSTDLPLGLHNLCVDTAQRAASGETIGHEVIQAMQQHRFAAARRPDIEVLEEVARLSRYLAASPAQDGSVLARVRHYQRHGAFADWCATRLRASLASSAEYARTAEALLLRHRARRDEENRAFAELLRTDFKPALHAEGVVPVYQIWKNPPLRQGPGDATPLYLAVLDGCSYAVFLRLLTELASEFQPLGLRVDPTTQEAHGRPALALLPSITSHSRSAIFQGEVPDNPWIAETVWRDTEEAASDPARFRQNEALGTRTRRLFLKRELADHGEKLIAALKDPEVSVVAAVFNAVDDQIGSANTGAIVSVKAKEISGFLPSLRAALDAGRRVVVTADHGHTPFVSLDLRVSTSGGKKGARAAEPAESGSARHRLLRDGEQAPDGFLEIDDGGLGGVPGRKAFAWKMGVYQGAPQVGFHGGCSLEELVVPLCEIAPGGVAADEPAWWYGGAATAATAATVATPPTTPAGSATPATPAPAPSPQQKAERPEKPVQGNLFDRAPLLSTDVDKLGLPPALREKLDASEQAALLCVFKNQHARISDIATSLARPKARVPGLMARLVTKLHEGGFPCLRRQTLADGEEQYRYVRQGTEKP